MDAGRQSLRSRGAADNPANRFVPLRLERDADWDPAEDPAPSTQFFEDSSCSVITRNDSPDISYDAGLNPYGNSVIVNAEYLKKNKPLIASFVKVTQKAFAACVTDPKPCVQALVEANGALKYDNEMTNWLLVEVLMSDKTSKSVALGWHDDARMAADYELVKTYIGLDKPFDVRTAYTNEFLDKSIKMAK